MSAVSQTHVCCHCRKGGRRPHVGVCGSACTQIYVLTMCIAIFISPADLEENQMAFIFIPRLFPAPCVNV